MNSIFNYLLPILVGVAGLLVLLSVAARRKRSRLQKEEGIEEGRLAVLDALKQGERICAVFDTADRRDLEYVQVFFREQKIPFILDEEGLFGQQEGYLPRDLVPLTLFVLRRDEAKARKVIEDYLKDKGKRPG